jgi:hypothetical protein
MFVSGAYVARLSGRVWAGLPTDLTIEQAMIRGIEERGGVTHGRGANKSVQAIGLATVHHTAAVKTSSSEFVNLEYCHNEAQLLGRSRAKRDNADLEKVLQF